jgi:hypothetical protein
MEVNTAPEKPVSARHFSFAKAGQKALSRADGVRANLKFDSARDYTNYFSSRRLNKLRATSACAGPHAVDLKLGLTPRLDQFDAFRAPAGLCRSGRVAKRRCAPL